MNFVTLLLEIAQAHGAYHPMLDTHGESALKPGDAGGENCADQQTHGHV